MLHMIAVLVMSMAQVVPLSASDRCSWSNAVGDQTAEIMPAVTRVFGELPIRVCYMLPGGGTALVWSPYLEEVRDYRVFRTTLCSHSAGSWVCESPIDAVEPRDGNARLPFELLGGAEPAQAFEIWSRIRTARFRDHDGELVPVTVGSIERLDATRYRLRGNLKWCGVSVVIDAAASVAPRVESTICM